jgi:DNA polymerase I
MLARVANIPVTEALASRRVSDWIRSMIHTHLRRNNVLIPTAEELLRGRQPHQVIGALTVAPKAGIYFNTVVCDFESLYPSCIDSFNLSYETVDCSHPKCRDNRIPDVDSHVCTLRRGFYSVLVGALKELRIKVFKPASKDSSLGEEERETASAAAKLLKLFLVSSYGVTVRIRGVACPPLAEAITGYGRYVLRESWKMAEEKGLRPLYGDTDSLFLDNANDEQVKWLISAVRERFHLDLAVDKRYSLCVLPKAKKAYFGIMLDGTPDIKGVTAAKSNTSGYVTKVFQQCIIELSSVKNREEYEQAKQRIRQVVAKAIQDLRSRRVKLEDLTYSVRLYFDPNEKVVDMKTAHQPYQCALQLIDAGRRLKRGDIVSFVKVKPFPYKGKTFTVKPVELAPNLAEINVADYVRNLLTALNQTFEPMHIKLEAEKEADISKNAKITAYFGSDDRGNRRS